MAATERCCAWRAKSPAPVPPSSTLAKLRIAETDEEDEEEEAGFRKKGAARHATAEVEEEEELDEEEEFEDMAEEPEAEE